MLKIAWPARGFLGCQACGLVALADLWYAMSCVLPCLSAFLVLLARLCVFGKLVGFFCLASVRLATCCARLATTWFAWLGRGLASL